MDLTYYGHSCFLIRSQEKRILFDPFITPNELADEINASQIEADYIILSHGHADHVADVELIAKNGNPTLIGGYEVLNWFGNKGLENLKHMNHGGTFHLDFGSVKMVNAVHSSSLPDGTYGGNPAGYVVRLEEGITFYYSGDTALHMDMKLIGESFNIDFAILCIGDTFTMGIDDALIASDFVGTDRIIGVHYDTFPPIELDKPTALAKAKNRNKKLELIRIGDTITIS